MEKITVYLYHGMKFRFYFLSVVFFLIVKRGFAQFPAFKWESCYTLNPFDVSSDERYPGDNFIERHDSIYYVELEGYIGSCNRTAITSKILLNRKKGKNLMVCQNGADLFACWMSGRDIMFQRSINHKGWLPEERFLVSTSIGSEYKMDNISFRNLPFIICDKSESKFNNRIYICWIDSKYSTEDKDVFLIYSDDRGEHWTEPILVSYRPNHKAQFAVQMEIDKKGFLYLIYYDKQNSEQGKLTDLTLAVSRNGGLKFDYYRVNKNSFILSDDDLPPDLSSIDYNPSNFFWRQEHVCYNVILDDSAYAAHNKALMAEESFLQMPKTISFSKKIVVPIALQDTTTITAVLTKPLDPNFEKVLFTEKKFAKGKNDMVLDTKKLSLEKRNYTLFLYYNFHNKFVWIVDE